MTPPSPVRLGFVGGGRATGELHLPAIARVPQILPVALCDSDPERLKALTAKFPRVKCYSALDAMLERAELDAVAVCTPPDGHSAAALTVLAADKHLFVEKPLALSLEDCDRVVARAAQSTRVAVMGFNLRQHRLLRRARELLQSGALGRVQMVRSSLTTDIRHTHRQPTWRDPRQTAGSPFFELGSHHFDLWRWLLGLEVEEVFAQRGGESEAPTALVTARLTDGVLGSAQFAERTYPENEIEILGEAGRLKVSLYDFDGLEFLPLARRPGSAGTRLTRIRRAVVSLPVGLRGVLHGGDYRETFAEEWRRFAACVRDGAPLAATLGDGRAAARISHAAVQSATEGVAVKLVGPHPLSPFPSPERGILTSLSISVRSCLLLTLAPPASPPVSRLPVSRTTAREGSLSATVRPVPPRSPCLTEPLQRNELREPYRCTRFIRCASGNHLAANVLSLLVSLASRLPSPGASTRRSGTGSFPNSQTRSNTGGKIMRKISLALSRVALAAIVAGLAACADNSSTPSGPTDPSLKGAAAGGPVRSGRIHSAPLRAASQPLEDLGGRCWAGPPRR